MTRLGAAPRWLDPLLAVVLTLLGQAELWSGVVVGGERWAVAPVEWTTGAAQGDQRAARFPPTGRGSAGESGEDEDAGSEVIPSARISRATRSNPTNRHAIAPRHASPMKAQVELPLPERAAVPKSMAA